MDDKMIALLQKRLRPFGLRVSESGDLIGGARLGVEPESMIDLPTVRDHIRRIQLGIDNDDSPLMLGASKQLLETTAKVVLRATSVDEPDDFPALLSRSLHALGLHPKGRSGRDDVGAATKRVLGGLQQIGLGINDLRNAYGTGHGRAEQVRLGLRHARLAAGAAVVLATAMIDTLEDPKAPWRGDSERADDASDAEYRVP